MPIHRVRKGEHLQFIARKYGLPWKKIWNHQENKALRDVRKTPDILLPGDKIYIPDKESKAESLPAKQKQQFRFKQAKVKLRLRLTDDFGEPLSGLSYALWIPGGKTLEDKLGDDGLIDQEIPANTRKLKLNLVDMNASFDLVVGELNPIGRVSGVQQRLQNLGYTPGRADNKIGPRTRAALMKFQAAEGLPITGKADKATRQKLQEVHDGIDRGEDLEDDEGVAVSVTASEGDAGANTPLETTLPNYEVNEQGDP